MYLNKLYFTQGELCGCNWSKMKGEWLTLRFFHCTDKLLTTVCCLLSSIFHKRKTRSITSSILVSKETFFAPDDCATFFKTCCHDSAWIMSIFAVMDWTRAQLKAVIMVHCPNIEALSNRKWTWRGVNNLMFVLLLAILVRTTRQRSRFLKIP